LYSDKFMVNNKSLKDYEASNKVIYKGKHLYDGDVGFDSKIASTADVGLLVDVVVFMAVVVVSALHFSRPVVPLNASRLVPFNVTPLKYRDPRRFAITSKSDEPKVHHIQK